MVAEVHASALRGHLHLHHSNPFLPTGSSSKYLLAKHAQLHRHQMVSVMLDNVVLLHRISKIAPVCGIRAVPDAFLRFGWGPPPRKEIGFAFNALQEAAEASASAISRPGIDAIRLNIPCERVVVV
ncbi:uncharacterized protein Aud_002719 [Aspergillus udagawae]|uniref:Uncharacterized protein n=1 Tax=Aspergillus udagawae TaxID=91492 RepID=A0A8E0QK99_9EURO|nr:uncharacterized protein Aud_002719 [Aspergillus udagawae]GIC86349.1 hypothetical protein Aud_002719 [Aspergillus udagawae]